MSSTLPLRSTAAAGPATGSKTALRARRQRALPPGGGGGGGGRPPLPMFLSAAGPTSRAVWTIVQATFLVLLCGSSYLAGWTYGQHEWSDAPSSSGGDGSSGPASLVAGRLTKTGGGGGAGSDCGKVLDEMVEIEVQKELARRSKSDGDGGGRGGNASPSKTTRFPRTMERYARGLARVKKDELDAHFDFGNPMDPSRGTGEEDALILYNDQTALPDGTAGAKAAGGDGPPPLLDAAAATKNCDAMNVVFLANPGNMAQCTAIVPNYESYHIQRWMRVKDSSQVDRAHPLSLVSRGYQSNGRQHFTAPSADGKNSAVSKHWKMLTTFLQNVDHVLDELRPILKRVAKNNAVVVLTCNRGQSALLMNFACSARRRGFDLERVLVFPSDTETRDLAEGLGLATYYDETNMGPLPSGEARRYGDRNFKAMMYAKVLCVLYPLMLGYDVLFQDVDIVWYKDPVDFFAMPTNGTASGVSKFDVIFQHDGANSVRYAPYSANSGFYYVRCNKRSQYLFTSLLYHGDLIINWDSHQQVLVQLLAEHSSLFGLNVKVFNRDTTMFPGGYHYHRRKDVMRQIVKGQSDAYIFHMSWTENKDNKLLFFRQMGEWYLQDTCIGKTANEILGGVSSPDKDAPLVQPCCALEPIFSCHYRDKASKFPCKDSPPIDKNGRSFW